MVARFFPRLYYFLQGDDDAKQAAPIMPASSPRYDLTTLVLPPNHFVLCVSNS